MELGGRERGRAGRYERAIVEEATGDIELGLTGRVVEERGKGEETAEEDIGFRAKMGRGKPTL